MENTVSVKPTAALQADLFISFDMHIRLTPASLATSNLQYFILYAVLSMTWSPLLKVAAPYSS